MFAPSFARNWMLIPHPMMSRQRTVTLRDAYVVGIV